MFVFYQLFLHMLSCIFSFVCDENLDYEGKLYHRNSLCKFSNVLPITTTTTTTIFTTTTTTPQPGIISHQKQLPEPFPEFSGKLKHQTTPGNLIIRQGIHVTHIKYQHRTFLHDYRTPPLFFSLSFNLTEYLLLYLINFLPFLMQREIEKCYKNLPRRRFIFSVISVFCFYLLI